MDIKFAFTAVSIDDVDRMLAFYRDLLGMEILSDTDTDQVDPQRQQFYKTLHQMPDTHFRMIRLKVPQPPVEEFALELKKWYSPTPKPFPGWQRFNDLGHHYVGLRVKNLEAVYQKLATAGVQFTAPPQKRRDLAAAFCYDPEGNLVVLIEPLT
ncbi:MAG: VOC family protein [Chloroflexi bacterium]|nr:VOC family protein [Chloroflexota bacterium]